MTSPQAVSKENLLTHDGVSQKIVVAVKSRSALHPYNKIPVQVKEKSLYPQYRINIVTYVPRLHRFWVAGKNLRVMWKDRVYVCDASCALSSSVCESCEDGGSSFYRRSVCFICTDAKTEIEKNLFSE